uniref:Secreted protein n=1 Tax=Steinernema glaseri TaxID=37863 RepID=A0A1I7ZK13_9BILA
MTKKGFQTAVSLFITLISNTTGHEVLQLPKQRLNALLSFHKQTGPEVNKEVTSRQPIREHRFPLVSQTDCLQC